MKLQLMITICSSNYRVFTTCYCTAAIVENLTDMRPEMCLEAAQQGLLQWLLRRIKVNYVMINIIMF